MSWKGSLYLLRRAQLLALLSCFESEHGHGPTIREIRLITGWDPGAICRYLEELALEGERVPPSPRPKNADRFNRRRDLLLKILRQFEAEHGCGPTLNEISAETGWDHRTLRRYLDLLAAEGIVRFRPGRRRAISLHRSPP